MTNDGVSRKHYWRSGGRVVFNGKEPYQVDVTPDEPKEGVVRLYHNTKRGQLLLGTLKYVGDAVVYSGTVASSVFGKFLNLAKGALYTGRKNGAEPEGLDASLRELSTYVEPLRRGETDIPKK